MTKGIINFFNSVEAVVSGFAGMIVSIFLSVVMQVAPLAAPIPPAFSVYTAMRIGLGVPEYIAVLAAISIEVTGIFSARAAVRAKNWNDTRLKSDPEASLGVAILANAVFFCVVFIMALTIELWPEMSVWVYPGFVIISITVYVNMALSMSLDSWAKAKETAKLERKEEAKSRRLVATSLATKRPVVAGDSRPLAIQETAIAAPKMAIAARRMAVEKLRADNFSRDEIAKELGVSLGTVKADISIMGKSNGVT